MSPIADALAVDPVASTARLGLSASQKWLPAWLFYDEAGSELFEQITALPEYYLTRTERALFVQYADEILLHATFGKTSEITFVELGAGTATKTGILLREAARYGRSVPYQPIDVSSSALEKAIQLESEIPGVTVHPLVANYVTEPYRIERKPFFSTVLVLYIGSSIGNFSPQQAHGVLASLRSQLKPGDTLLLGADLAPGKRKSIARLLAAYDDTAGVTAAFNLNVLTRLNRELGADFDLDCFTHEARWNASASAIEMHLASTCAQTVVIPANAAGPELVLHFTPGETIHTENSYKFTPASIAELLTPSGFDPTRTFSDPDCLFAVTLATAV